MPKLNIDFSDLPAEFIPEGEYDAIITDVTLKTSNNTGSQYLLWNFELTQEGEAAGRKVNMMTSLVPQALFGLKRALETMGCDASSVAEIEVDEESGLMIEPNFDGFPVQVHVYVDEYQGRKNNKVRFITQTYRTYGGALATEEEGYVAEEGVVPLDEPLPGEGESSGIVDMTDMEGYVDMEPKGDAAADEFEVAADADSDETAV